MREALRKHPSRIRNYKSVLLVLRHLNFYLWYKSTATSESTYEYS